ncbi:MAG: hypothetical protein RLZZ435_2036 [Cyanobacteriota bacterium]|jgi:uncharacterized membrane protein
MLFKQTIRNLSLSLAISICLLFGFVQSPILAATLADIETVSPTQTISADSVDEEISFTDQIESTAQSIQSKVQEVFENLTNFSNTQPEELQEQASQSPETVD